MQTFYLVVVILLLVLAVSDLIVGVSNDAVNFLNSALGSKAAPFRIIMLVAAAGILVGATFSSGMMEVARKGIFHPDQFVFAEIMIIFLAVMMTDIILLDLFNTFGMPTSTTVSVVFELLGSAVAVALLKIHRLGESVSTMSDYINTSSALLIISGILLSVIVAFTFGAVIQYIVRIAFSFNYEKYYKYFGPIWGGIAISLITYFILIKGAKGSSFMGNETVLWIKENTRIIMILSLVGWTGLLQILHLLFRINMLKVIVLIGTFALAMAFAGNDLVNFIGVPLAGLESFRDFMASGNDVMSHSMGVLNGPVKTPTLLLLIAGLIMVITLYLSRKARSVTATTLDLSRQDEGYERFESSAIARNIVRGSINISSFFSSVIPARVSKFIDSRFDHQSYIARKKESEISFDLIRASVTLVVASALIALGTSLKLPLSTTYVTFMVAMGTSLADRAWGRESAVYRISGVITVIFGWFFTAFCAFATAFLIAYLIDLGGMISIGIMIALSIFLIIKTHGIHRKRGEEKEKEVNLIELNTKNGEIKNILSTSNKNIYKILSSISILYTSSLDCMAQMKRKKIKNTLKEIQSINKETKLLKNNVHKTILELKEDDIETGHFYVQVIDYLRETSHCLTYIADPVFEYIDNNHPPLSKEQQTEIQDFAQKVNRFLVSITQRIKSSDYSKLSETIDHQQTMLDEIIRLKKKQLKRIKNHEVGTKNSGLYLNTLSETKNLLLYVVNLLKAERDLVIYANRQLPAK